MELVIRPSPSQAPWLPKILYTFIIILAMYGSQFLVAIWQLKDINVADFASDEEIYQYLDFTKIILYTAIIACTVMLVVFHRYEKKYHLVEFEYSLSNFVKNAILHFCGLFISLYTISLIFSLKSTANNDFIFNYIDNLYVAFIAIVVAAPIMEELFFRRWFIGYLGNFSWASLLISSVIFGASHLANNFNEFVVYLIAGLYLGWVYKTYRNIKLNILLHMFNNLFGFIEIYFRHVP